MRTPESEPGKPFKVTQIQPAGNWKHDFKDGRGSILAYGKWFIRLSAKGWKGIGIHGSTNNEESVPGRGSEGCIRLKDKDIIHLKENYVYIGMKVIVDTEEYVISNVDTDDLGRTVAHATIDLPDGKYNCKIVVEEIHPIVFLMEGR